MRHRHEERDRLDTKMVNFASEKAVKITHIDLVKITLILQEDGLWKKIRQNAEDKTYFYYF